MDVHDKLDELTALVESARSMPMSASCIVNRGEVLGLLDEMRGAAARGVRRGRALLRDREGVLDEGPRRGRGDHRRGRTRSGCGWSPRPRSTPRPSARPAGSAPRPREEAGRMRDETDAYVDGKLANFEIALDQDPRAAVQPRP